MRHLPGGPCITNALIIEIVFNQRTCCLALEDCKVRSREVGNFSRGNARMRSKLILSVLRESDVIMLCSPCGVRIRL